MALCSTAASCPSSLAARLTRMLLANTVSTPCPGLVPLWLLHLHIHPPTVPQVNVPHTAWVGAGWSGSAPAVGLLGGPIHGSPDEVPAPRAAPVVVLVVRHLIQHAVPDLLYAGGGRGVNISGGAVNEAWLAHEGTQWRPAGSHSGRVAGQRALGSPGRNPIPGVSP